MAIKRSKLQQSNAELDDQTATLSQANEHLLSGITNRQQFEQNLKNSQEWYRQLVELSPESIIVYTNQAIFLYANPATANLLGVAKSTELVGQELWKFLHPDFYDLLSQQILFSEQHRASTGLLELRFLRADAQPIDVELVGVPVVYQGQAAHQGFLRDITQRKRAETALRSSMATNRALLNAMPDLMFRISQDGIFVNYKEGKNTRLPVPPETFIGKHLSQVLPEDLAQTALNSIVQALATGEVQHFEFQLSIGGKSVYYEIRLVSSDPGEVISVVRDITERKLAEEEIYSALAKEKQLGELKSHFVTTTSHEFRTPLSTILSSAELLEHYGQAWPEKKKAQHLQRIQNAAQRMTELLDDILTFEQSAATKLELRPSLIMLEEFCRELVTEWQLGLGQPYNLVFNVEGQISQFYADTRLLRQILNNLLSNAIKYSPKGSHIYFDLIYQPGEAIFCVRDQGIGIPKVDQLQIFNAFHRGNNIGSITGTGLGLAVVKKAVDLHGGQVSFESSEGTGTTFKVVLPSVQPAS
jgi:PAS domain S-box-containing protein